MLTLVQLTQEDIDAIVAAVPGGAGNIQDIYPLAPLQEGILFHHLMAAEGDPYLALSFSTFNSRQALDAQLTAWRRVIARHDILRTSIMWEGLREPVQVVWRDAPLPVTEVSLDPANGEIARQLYARFDPRRHRLDLRRAPLLEACIAQDRARDQWVLLLRQHHITGDHVAFEVLKAEIRAHLAGREDTLPPPLPFRTYVAQSRAAVSGADHEAYFRKLLGDVRETTAPFGLLDVWGSGSGIAEARAAAGAELSRRVRAAAQTLQVSAASICHVAWAMVLARVCGRQDVVFGTVLFGRLLGGDGADRVMGPFINTLPLRVRIGAEGAAATVRKTHRQLTELLSHEHASLALAQRCSGVPAPAPLFTALLNYRRSSAGDRDAAPGAGADALGTMQGARSNYPVTLSVDDRARGLVLKAKVPAAVGPERVCAMMLRALEGVIDALELTPGRDLARVDVLPASERALVVETWNRTQAELAADACVHQLFEAQQARTPDAVAVVGEQETLSYAELNRRANRFAHWLIARGVGPDARVGICLERGSEMVVAVLAVLKAGGAYVPLDPDYPRDRLRVMVQDSAPVVLLTQSAYVERFAELHTDVAAVDARAHEWATGPDGNPARKGLHADHLAYVIYTSGSTGEPKGVMVEHRGVVNRLTWGHGAWGLEPGGAIVQKTSLNFDGSLREVFWPLMAGARVVLARPDGQKDPSYLLRTMRDERVGVINLVPSMLHVLIEHDQLRGCTALRSVLCGGEALPAALLQRVRDALPGVALHNLYGPSEAATAACALECVCGAAAPNGADRPPDREHRASTCSIASGAPAPMGVAGEIYIGGARRGARLSEPAGADGGALRRRSVQRTAGRAAVPHRRSRRAGCADGNARVPRAATTRR